MTDLFIFSDCDIEPCHIEHVEMIVKQQIPLIFF